MQKEITLAMGNGGVENNELIKKVFYKYFKNDILSKNEDGAVLDIKGPIVTSTDSFTISPLFFPGGDIGKLSVCGTCNDLAMMGAKPKFLTISFIIEEGFSIRELEKIAKSIKKELEINGAVIVSGDTKVMPKGSIDKIIINTSGIGELLVSGISSNNIEVEDVILVNRDIGCHGATIFTKREGIDFETNLESDCASLSLVVKDLIDNNINIKALRDATRGGVSAVLNEWANQNNLGIVVQEDKIPVSESVKGVCEILGFEPVALANEGTFCIVVKENEAQKTLEILKKYNKNASLFAKVVDKYNKKVILESAYGTKRVMEYPSGELLPRIC